MTANQDFDVLDESMPSTPEDIQFVRPSSVVDELVDFIRTEIARGTLKSGRLRINRLAERFGVSAVPVREALRRLQAEGLVVFGRNREVRVVELSEAEIREIFLMRSLLEPLLLREAVPYLLEREEDWSIILQTLERMDDVELGSPAWLELNARFHQTMYKAADMPTVLRIVQGLWTGANAVLVRYGQSKQLVAVAQTEHHEMVRLIKKSDQEGVAELLRRHLMSTYEECQRLMNHAASPSEEGVNGEQ